LHSETEKSDSVAKNGNEDLVSDIGSPGPFSVSARVGIMMALLGSKRATFTELLLAVKTPKSSLNKNLGILEDCGFVKQRRGFLPTAGPRTIVEITPKGEEAIKKHLELMRSLADKFLGSKNTDSSQNQENLTTQSDLPHL
jgi:DNA-binding MarR family transcriptional regulator